MATKTIHSMAYRLLVDDTDFRKGMKLSQSEFGKLKREMTSTLTPLEKMQVELQQLEKIVQKDARAQEVYNRKFQQYQELLKKSNPEIAKLQKSMGAYGGAMGAVGSQLKSLLPVIGVGMFTNSIRRQFEEVDKLAKASRKLGVDIEFLQQVNYAASLTTSASVDQVGKALRDLEKNAGAAARGQKEMAAAFEMLGIGADELQKMKPDELFYRVVDALRGVDNQASQLELSQKIMGEGGSEFIPLIKEGSVVIREMAEEFRKLGGIVDEHAAKKIEAANDQINKMNVAWTRFKRELATSAAPTVEAVSAYGTRVLTGEQAFGVGGNRMLRHLQETRPGGPPQVMAPEESLDGTARSSSDLSPAMLQELKRIVGLLEGESEQFNADRRTRVE